MDDEDQQQNVMGSSLSLYPATKFHCNPNKQTNQQTDRHGGGKTI